MLTKLTCYLPTHKNEDGLTTEQSRVLAFLKAEVAKTQTALPGSNLIREFGYYHIRFKSHIWKGTTLQELLDKGVVEAVLQDTPAHSS